MDNFVSRGGIKLQAAIENFKLKIENLVCLDVGSSTGGFVDCLLQNGAQRVYAVDTSYGELAWKLRNDSRVVVMERTNILHLQHLPAKNISEGGRAISEDSSEVNKMDLITIDAGWTKLGLVLPVVKKFLKPEGIIIALLKPQYETEKRSLVKGVVPVDLVEGIKTEVIKEIEKLEFKIENYIESPILGGAGNQEYLLLLKF